MSGSYTLDDYGFERYEENAFPIAYLLTFTTYGTRLHGDARDSFERSRDERFGTIKREPNVPLNEKMRKEMRTTRILLDKQQRDVVSGAIAEVCETRGYSLRAMNVRSTHGHVVVSATVNPEKIVNDFKAYSTRRLRQGGFIPPDVKIWTRGASTRYLWKPAHVSGAVEYVLYSQGDDPPGTIHVD